MSAPASTLPRDPIPEVYILWHPNCTIGHTSAKRIYEWLRPGNGLGPRVFYRSLPAPTSTVATPGSPLLLPLPLPGESRLGATTATRQANLQIVLPLIDANMVADGGWRYWLDVLQRKTPSGVSREILPVAIDSTAFGAPPSIRELNFIRPRSPRPVADLDDREREAFLRSLIKQLTEALCRLLLGGGDPLPNAPPAVAGDPGGALKLKVFLSHAKADGTIPARRVRDYIYSQTQLAAFYDENDIPFGSAFTNVLEREAEAQTTVALIAIRSPRYALRPWCRREISLFRRPRYAGSLRDGSAFHRLNPVLVVSALEPGVPTLGVPEFGNAPEVQWSPDVPNQEEQLVTTLLRDALLSEFHANTARVVQSNLGDVVLNWLPDPTTLLGIAALRPQTPTTVHYPGHLSALEAQMLREFFPHVTLSSFEESWS